MEPIQVERENIPAFKFPPDDVLKNKAEIDQRTFDAYYALVLGENYSVKIIFEDNESLKQVESSITGLREEKLLLKQGIHIPVYRIYKIIVLGPEK